MHSATALNSVPAMYKKLAFSAGRHICPKTIETVDSESPTRVQVKKTPSAMTIQARAAQVCDLIPPSTKSANTATNSKTWNKDRIGISTTFYGHSLAHVRLTVPVNLVVISHPPLTR